MRAADDSRLTKIDYSDTTPDVTFAYDNYGRVTSMTDGEGVTTYTYDDLDNVLSVTTTYNGLPARTISYAYFTDGTRRSMTIPTLPAQSPPLPNGGNTFTYAYDELLNLRFVNCPWTGGNYSYTYLANGWPETQTYAKAITTFTYNPRGFLIGLKNANRTTGNPVISEFNNFVYDAIGNCTQMQITIPQVGAAADVSGFLYRIYDNKNRLSGERRTLTAPPFNGIDLYNIGFGSDGVNTG